MIKTTYQTPEIRNANDEIIQEGAFGKNTALSNSTNDGWIDYVVNNLEALHDTIGDSAAHLDGNGHVVEPANLAIGDEDGLNIKTGYLKLTGGTVTGTTNFQQNVKFQDNQENVFGGVYVPSSSSTEQYAQFYGGESVSVAGAKLTLYPDGDGRFKLDARSTDGSNTYTLVTDNNGNLNWRGYPLAWKKDYLPLIGGTLSGWLQFSSQSGRIQMSRSSSNNDGDLGIYGGSGYSTGAYLYLNGAGRASQAGCFGIRAVADGSTYKELQGRPDGTLLWGGNSIALSKDVLPLAGGTMTGAIIRRGDAVYCNADDSFVRLNGGSEYTSGASLQLNGQTANGRFALMARKSGVGAPVLLGDPDGTLMWNNKNIECINASGTNYVRYDNGLQICWRSGASFNTDGTQIVFPVPFKDATYSVSVTTRGLTTSTNIALAKVTEKASAGFVAMAVATSNISSFTGGSLDYIAIGLWK